MAVVVFLLLFTAWYIVFHGFIRLVGLSKDTPTTYWQFNKSLQRSSLAKTEANPALLQTGEYTLQATMKNGGVYSTNTTAPYLFGTKTVSIPDFEADITPLGRRVARSIAVGSAGSLISWDTSGGVYAIDNKNITSNVEFDTSIAPRNFSEVTEYKNLAQLSSSSLVGLSKVSKGVYRPVVYDFNTGGGVTYPNLKDASGVTLRLESSGFSVYQKKLSTVSFYQQDSASVIRKKVNQSEKLALRDGNPIYSFQGNAGRLAIATGPPSYTGGDVHENTVTNQESSTVLSVFDTKNDTLLSRRVFDKASILGLSLSPDGKYIIVNTTDSTSVYDAAGLSPIMTLPLTTTDRIFWLKDNDFVINAHEKGVMKVSLSDKEAYALVPYSLIRPTKLSFVDNDYLYFTGFSSLNDHNDKPDAYRLSISKNTSPEERRKLRGFPHQGNGFYTDRLNGVTTVQLSRYISSRGVLISESARQDALDYVKSILGDKEKVNFTYVTTDLRVRDTGEE